MSTRPGVNAGEAFIIDHLEARCRDTTEKAYAAASDELDEWHHHRSLPPERAEEIKRAAAGTPHARAVRRILDDDDSGYVRETLRSLIRELGLTVRFTALGVAGLTVLIVAFVWQLQPLYGAACVLTMLAGTVWHREIRCELCGESFDDAEQV